MFSRPETWLYLGIGALGGYALGRVVLLVLPPLALFYGVAFLMGRADPASLVLLLEGAFRGAWSLLLGAPLGLSLGLSVGFVSGIAKG
ncbi:MAG: hypothetical protein P3W93_006640 [Thermus sp.]|nr:hypothetical protein [Thermus sp.]